MRTEELTVTDSRFGEYEIYKTGQSMSLGTGADPVYVFVK